MLSIGLDVHQNFTALCRLDASGRRVGEETIRGRFHAVAERLRRIDEPFRVCFEASCGYGTLHDLLMPIASEVQVAHPTELSLIFRSKHKNDRNDARKIAKLLHMDEIPRVHVPSIEIRAWRGLIEHRRRLVDKRTRVKNALRAQLRNLGIKAPGRSALWSKAGVEWLGVQELPTVLDRIKRDTLLAELQTLHDQVKIVVRELDAIGKNDWRVTLLRTMPGIGPRTAEAIAAYIDEPDRFGNIKAIGKYFGVVPSQAASAGKNRLGHITREGPATVRKLITEGTWQAIRRSPRLRAFHERVMAGQRQRRATALVATAHKMLRIALAMLRTRQPWREEDVSHPPAVPANGIEARRSRRGVRGEGSSRDAA